MFVKELRETAGIVLLALAAYVYAVTNLAGAQIPPVFLGEEGIPFVGGCFVAAFAMISGSLVVALGLRQSLGESYRGTYLLLLHRPESRQRLIGAKLLAGAGVYLILSVAPILAYGWWAATPGTHASPFEWSMTVPAWKVWIALVPLYLAAFLTGIRPAHWFGTRLAPLAAVGLLVALVQFVPWWPVFALLVAALTAALTGNIFFVAKERDY
jgi:hypothetical protein